MRRFAPLALIVLGLACLVAMGIVASGVTVAKSSFFGPTLFGFAIAGAMFILVGALARRAVGPDAHVDSRHAYPLFAMVGLVVGGALTARHLLVPESFGRYGHFRGIAPQEARRIPVRHQGEKRCAECHEKVLEVHAKDAHVNVTCETCHGATKEHVENPERKPKVDRSQDACMMCHRRLNARPAPFPQIDVAEHYKLVGVSDQKLACTKCHSPHEPLFVDRDLRQARLHPLVHRCRDCHAGRGDDAAPMPEKHPPIFDCQYCHKERVADFATRKHKNLRCSTCHIFRKETPFAGRIVRDSDPRFCLLCHRKAPFRSASAAPGIEPEKHLEDMGAEPKASCLECHKDSIHADLPKSAAPPGEKEAQPSTTPEAPRPPAVPEPEAPRPQAVPEPEAPRPPAVPEPEAPRPQAVPEGVTQ